MPAGGPAVGILSLPRAVPEGLTYAVVEKVRKKGRVAWVGSRVVFGTLAAVALALGFSKVSRAINTTFLERENGTARHRNARKVRRSYRFSKDWRPHEAVTYVTMYSYNFCWAVRTLRVKDDRGRRQARSPAVEEATPRRHRDVLSSRGSDGLAARPREDPDRSP